MATLLTLLALWILGAVPAAAQVDTTVPATETTLAAVTTDATQPAGGEAIKGVLRNRDDDNSPVSGVEITVKAADGTEIGVATSDDDGAYELALPGPGQYTATLDVDTLPDGVRLTDASKTTLTFSVNPDQSRPLLFPFGKDTRQVATTLDRIVPLTISGIRLGLIIAMTAIGLSLIYGTTQFTNFAHGEMVTFGAIIAWYLNQNAGLHLIPAALLAMLFAGAAGWGLELGLWKPLRKRKSSLFGLMVVSFGLSILLQAVFLYQFGSRSRPYNDYSIQTNGVHILGAIVPPKEFAVIGISVVVLGAVGLFIKNARFGKAMRAVADNPALASSSGINTDRVVLLVWIGGSALAALGGVLYSISDQVSFQEGQTLLLLMFAGITLGGLGTAFGAAAGCLLLGLLIQLSTLWVPSSLKNVGALVALIVVLMIKPEGLFGRRERVG